jgi:hypothetical protein
MYGGWYLTVADTYSDYSHDWHTPPEWWSWINETNANRTHYDPCPEDWDPTHYQLCDVANWIDAFDCEDDLGLVYVNHPGGRGETQRWWTEGVRYVNEGGPLIWCAFNVEQLRHMRPSPFALDGWLVMPRERIGYLWGGPDTGKRKHGERCKSPANWSVFWTTLKPAPTPVPCTIVRTGRE